MLTAPATAEALRRTATRITGRVHSLPILALHVHSACNCRCVMCDIWKANVEKREISIEVLERNVAAIKRLRVQRVMLTGGEPLLHSNLWAFCQRLRKEGVRLTLVTTGLLLEPHASRVSRLFDEVVISVDGPADTHDAIRRVRGGFERLARGVSALRDEVPRPRLVARCVVQKANYHRLADTISSVQELGFDSLSFLAADLSSTAFNRPDGWPPDRQAEIALPREDVRELAGDIAGIERAYAEALRIGFVQGGAPSLWRIFNYYAALAGLRELPPVRCNAPWVSAVLEPGGAVRPCFFHPPYPAAESGELDDAINSPAAIAFRRQLDVRRDETCRRCVCTLSLPLMRDV